LPPPERERNAPNKAVVHLETESRKLTAPENIPSGDFDVALQDCLDSARQTAIVEVLDAIVETAAPFEAPSKLPALKQRVLNTGPELQITGGCRAS
jgi:hypothetical protein